MTSLDIADATSKQHKHVLADVRKEIEELGEEISQPLFRPSVYTNRGKEYPCYEFGREGAMQLALKYDAKTRYLVIKKIEELEQGNNEPQSIEDLIIMQANSVKEVREKVDKQSEQLETVNHRLDNIDQVDTIGDLQQRFNAMVRKYAQLRGVPFGNAWKEFRTAYNTAYRTNLKMKINNYKDKHGIKNLTMPQFLSVTDSLKDAIRVADKMLNKGDK